MKTIITENYTEKISALPQSEKYPEVMQIIKRPARRFEDINERDKNAEILEAHILMLSSLLS